MLVLRAALAAVAPEVPPPPGEPRLEWVAPPQCPDETRGAEHLTRFLGGRELPAPARVELAPSPMGLVATVTVDGATRTLHAVDCETLARAAALVVAVSLDPIATAAMVLEDDRGELERPASGSAQGRAPAQLSTSSVATAREPSGAQGAAANETIAPPPARRRGWDRADMPPRADAGFAGGNRHWLAASGGIGLAIIPPLTGAVRLGYAFERSLLRVQAEITYAAPRPVTYVAEPTVGGRFQTVALGARACFAPAAGRVAVPLCGGVEGGPIFGRGIGVSNMQSPVGAWVGGLAGAAAVVRVHARLALVAGAELLVALSRPAFHVGTRGTLFTAMPMGLRAMAGIELRLR